MTQPPEVTTAVPSPPADPGRWPRRRVVALFVIASLALVVGAVVTWHRLAAQRADQVEVAWVGLPQCTGAEVSPDAGRWGPQWSGPYIKAERGMRCIVTVEVRNRSGSNVHLEHARMPLMGPGAGPVIKVDTTTNPDLWSAPPADHSTVLRILDTTLGAGEATTFEIPVVFRENGCSGGPRQGGFTTMHGFPTVTVSSLTLSFDRPAANNLSHTQVSPSRGCGRMSRG